MPSELARFSLLSVSPPAQGFSPNCCRRRLLHDSRMRQCLASLSAAFLPIALPPQARCRPVTLHLRHSCLRGKSKFFLQWFANLEREPRENFGRGIYLTRVWLPPSVKIRNLAVTLGNAGVILKQLDRKFGESCKALDVNGILRSSFKKFDVSFVLTHRFDSLKHWFLTFFAPGISRKQTKSSGTSLE